MKIELKNMLKFSLILLLSSAILFTIGIVFSNKIFEVLTFQARSNGIDFGVNTFLDAFVLRLKTALFFLLIFENLLLTSLIYIFFIRSKKFLLPFIISNLLYFAGVVLYFYLSNLVFFKTIVNTKSTITAEVFINSLFLAFATGVILELPALIAPFVVSIKDFISKKFAKK
jgi:hypothetical protein